MTMNIFGVENAPVKDYKLSLNAYFGGFLMALVSGLRTTLKNITIFLFIFPTVVFAADVYNAKNLDPHKSQPIAIEDLVKATPKGAIVVVGEQHNFAEIQAGQMSLLKALRNAGHKVNVAMEFLKYSDQSSVDAYRNGTLSEDDFKKSSWGESIFKFYKDQLLFPNASQNEKTYAVNSPTTLPIAVKTKGIENLTPEEKALLPPHFQLGAASYRERFEERMKGHVTNEQSMQRYFEAQSVWDDTMAWRVCEAMKTSTNTMVLIVGQFHVEHGDGLIARIKSRCGPQQPIVSIFQYLFYNDEEIDLSSFVPSPKYGPVSDYLMVVKEK